MNLFNLSFIEKLLNTIMQKLNNSFAYKLLKKWNLTFEADYARVNKTNTAQKGNCLKGKAKVKAIIQFSSL
jgi:hypothetical protein